MNLPESFFESDRYVNVVILEERAKKIQKGEFTKLKNKNLPENVTAVTLALQEMEEGVLKKSEKKLKLQKS